MTPPFHYSTNSSDNSKGGIYSGFQPQAESEAAHSRKKRSQHITVTALYCLLLCLTPPFHYSTNSSDNSKGGIVSGDSPHRRFAILSCTASALKAELGAAHCHRRNLKQPLPQKRSQHITVTALYCLSLCLFPPFHYSTNSSGNSKGGIVSGDSPQALSRCRLLQRKYQRIASPMRKHRHNAPLYCPYIRLRESYLPSFHRLYRRQ